MFVDIADELDHDSRWPERMTVLIRAGRELVDKAQRAVRELVGLVYDRRRKQAALPR